MNCISIVGRLVADPELKKTASGTSVSQFCVAVDRPHSKDKADFLYVVAWRHSAEYVSQYGRKGNVVAINGYLSSRKYEDKSGAQRTAYEIVADAVYLCGGKNSDSAQAPTFSMPQQDYEEIGEGDEDLPF